MKETKPLYLVMILIFIFTLIYNLILPITLNQIPDMIFKNKFFMVEYSHLRNDNILSTDHFPNFLNWMMILLFIGVFISLLVRKHINKVLNPYKIGESQKWFAYFISSIYTLYSLISTTTFSFLLVGIFLPI